MTQKEYKAKIKALEPMDDETRKSVTCALLGHSAIVTTFFGYVNCARCGKQIGDTLCGSASLEKNIVVGHNCQKCHANYDALGWKDKVLCPDPFADGR